MAHITIKNVGPIKDVSLELNKINIFMGPQSSGKSTIAKIISYCSWLEKDMVLNTNTDNNINNKNLFEQLISFHNLEENYFNKDSYISYKSGVCEISMYWDNKKKSNVEISLGDSNHFENRKISYIPAERNFVTLPGLGKYTDSKGNIMDFMYDWFLAKNDVSVDKKFILPIIEENEFAYYYDKNEDKDTILLKNGKTLQLSRASSGLRSCIPMLVVFHYTMETIYSKKRTKSPFEIVGIQDKVQFLPEDKRLKFKEILTNLSPIIDQYEKLKDISEFRENTIEKIKDYIYNLQEQMANAVGLYSDYHFSQIIIEEPELNLFPQSQQELIYHILTTYNQTNRPHQLVLTTHSPFILFAVNNCMMGGLIREKMPKEEQKEIPSFSAWINPSSVSIYEIHDGTICSIQDKDGIIEDNYLNQAYKENSNEYLNMLNYYDDEE